MKEEKMVANPLGTADLRRLVFNFSVPAVVSFLMTSLYNVVDQIFIGWGIGTLGMAATNVSFPLTTVCTALTLLFGTGGAAVFNISLGRKNDKVAAKTAGNAFALLAVFGLLLGLITAVFTEPLLYAFGATEAVMEYAKPYTFVIAFGLPSQTFAAGAGLIIRADGSPRIAMSSVLAGGVFNLIFDPIFLFVMKMGIIGIALATILGQLLSFVIVLWYLLRSSARSR
ncbi:MAG: polysaccharide biosynthesis C-terminal domain-containing protein [Oscillospiraceae bacterium]|jgi:Na+-driven multidrug efflux pump|nr:polysaccharide biosynthesis C-terminal domain-containing protein [Oscillospiraceae bacterium]